MPFASQAVRLFYGDTQTKQLPPLKRKTQDIVVPVPKKRKVIVDAAKATTTSDQRIAVKRPTSAIQPGAPRDEVSKLFEPVNNSLQGTGREHRRKRDRTSSLPAAIPSVAPKAKVGSSGTLSCYQCGSTKTYAWRHDAEGNKICDTCRSRNRSREQKEQTRAVTKAPIVRESKRAKSPSERMITRRLSASQPTTEASRSPSVETRSGKKVKQDQSRPKREDPPIVEKRSSRAVKRSSAPKRAASPSPVLRSSRRKQAKTESPEPAASPSEPRRSGRALKRTQANTARIDTSPPISPTDSAKRVKVVAEKPEGPSSSTADTSTSIPAVKGNTTGDSKQVVDHDDGVKRCTDCGGTHTAGTWRKESSGGILCNRCMVRRWRASKGRPVFSKIKDDVETSGSSSRRSSLKDTSTPVIQSTYGTRARSSKKSYSPEDTPAQSTRPRKRAASQVSKSPPTRLPTPPTTRSATTTSPYSFRKSPAKTFKSTAADDGQPQQSSRSKTIRASAKESGSKDNRSQNAPAINTRKAVSTTGGDTKRPESPKTAPVTQVESTKTDQALPRLALFPLPPTSPQSAPPTAQPSQVNQVLGPSRPASVPAKYQSLETRDDVSFEVALRLKRARQEQQERNERRELNILPAPEHLKHQQRQAWKVRPQTPQESATIPKLTGDRESPTSQEPDDAPPQGRRPFITYNGTSG
ncbi:hypothetical protein BCR37DRAFT_379611 [Protomyces lactucae-debilis]|uniref:GATA-type domain-containing protein n=1 Tax=Protomyces lactucae-debilis TaxID=2754530 RepID=A0A1Y2FFA7_PROLT|nr:uncharacterized protein BCR37DRAFT_379611 [Protomyces lactucae-debilis]ORY82602.1 hypothetical protein BCR37DRAFT_379611 [Protomyces lactucae-debilis]